MNEIAWQAEYTRRRERQQRALREREEQIRQAWPEFEKWKKKKSAARVDAGLARAQANLTARKAADKKLAALESERKKKFAELGLDTDALELHYDCALCRDYGVVAGHPCECLCEYLGERRADSQGWADFSHQNFESFSLDFFPEEEGQRERMKKAHVICEAYAEQCPMPTPQNLLLIGTAGLGKTFLLHCIGKRAQDHGIRVQKIKAHQFHRIVMNQVIGNENERPYRKLVEADLLLFDDLGSEPITKKSMTESYFFALLDERLSAKRATALTTNLSDADLFSRYGGRGVSRLFDRSNCRVLALRGKDMRLRRSRQVEGDWAILD